MRPDDPSGPCHGQRTSATAKDHYEHEVEAMFAAAEDRAASGQAEALRNLALLELLYGSCLRATNSSRFPGAVRPSHPS